jgi:hypothetical protein
MGDVVGNALPQVIQSALSQARRYGTVVIVVLGKKAISGLERAEEDPLVRVLSQPTTLRDIRHAITELRERNASAG